MNDEMLFQIQRIAMLRLATEDGPGRKLSDADAHAWSESVYPLFSPMEWHTPFKKCFDISEEMVSELNKRLGNSWSSKDGLTFYDLETEYGIYGLAAEGPIWGRVELINACRYLFLKGNYDSVFWTQFLSRAPAEANSINASFSIDQIYFS